MLKIFSNFFGKQNETPREHVIAFYEAMKPYHEANCRQWYANLAMLRGNQWAIYEGNSDNLRVPMAPSWRVRATFNKLLPLSILQRHKLIPNNPTISTRPANPLSKIDQENAALARQLLRAQWKQQDFQEEINELAGWMVSSTVGYLLTLWDGQQGKEIDPGVGMGEQIFEAASPFEVIPDYSYGRFKDVPRFMRAKVRSIEYIEKRYGKKVKPQKLEANSIFQLKALALSTNARVDINKIVENHALVMDMYELPSVAYPNGFHMVCTEDCDLTEQMSLDPYYEMDNGDKKYFLPWDTAQMIRLSGMLVGTNSVEQATPAQCFYNQGKSVIIENAKRLGRTKVFAPIGKIAQGAMVDDPAEVIVEYDPDIPGEITPFKPPEMAGYHLDFINSLPREIQDIFGIHDASLGVLPRRATSGKAISFLTEADDERHFDPKDDIDKAIGGAFRKALNIMANSYKETRIKDLIGDDGKLITKSLKGEQLRAADVTITRDIALPKEASARMDLAIEILGKKPSKEDLEIIFAIMQAQDMEDLKSILQGNSMAEETYARMENFDMAKSIDRPVSIGENHEMHQKLHDMKLKDPNTTQAAKMLIMKHIQEHQQQAGIEATMGPAGAQPAPEAMPNPEAIPPQPEQF